MTLFLTGCNGKKLACQHSATDSFQGTEITGHKFIYNDKGNLTDVVINYKTIYNQKYIDTYAVNMDEMIAEIESVCTELKDIKNTTCTAKLDGTTLYMNIKYNVAKMSNEDLNNLGLTEIIATKYDDMKKEYQNMGFTCQ